MTEDEMVGWHHRLNGHELGQTPRNGEGQGGLACYSPWGHKELDRTERLKRQLNNNKDTTTHLLECQNQKGWLSSLWARIWGNYNPQTLQVGMDNVSEDHFGSFLPSHSWVFSPEKRRCASLWRLIQQTHSSFICYIPQLEATHMSFHRYVD